MVSDLIYLIYAILLASFMKVPQGLPIIDSCIGFSKPPWNVFTICIPSGRFTLKLVAPYGMSMQKAFLPSIIWFEISILGATSLMHHLIGVFDIIFRDYLWHESSLSKLKIRLYLLNRALFLMKIL